ncbi:MAG: hypothetical protein A2V81_01995 [Candidatus Abawacabacteria bacterium RBG_16_42_10]|uniref:Uncharacterized protein n=1 Tax=Candidatus Abawacabacteria bacterium RBG_16_42_10 TaxID=1817814 RepID=A0A1F4XKW1_9BACT|nr:MAG: hypothetical protein A2V81_01995 [Candidatus Abawacabacteria bacterium RBG_16_42_10]
MSKVVAVFATFSFMFNFEFIGSQVVGDDFDEDDDFDDEDTASGKANKDDFDGDDDATIICSACGEVIDATEEEIFEGAQLMCDMCGSEMEVIRADTRPPRVKIIEEEK